VVSAQTAEGAERGWFDGLKLAGTALPGVITAGTFYQHGELVFWDVHDGANAIRIQLDHERYKELIVEVAEPSSDVQRINHAAARARLSGNSGADSARA
jgi:hypothetical protein